MEGTENAGDALVAIVRGPSESFVARPHRLVFDDFDGNEPSGFEFHESASDRELAFCIWTQLEAGDFHPGEGWSLLYHRYPRDLRFLLLAVFEGWMSFDAPLVRRQLGHIRDKGSPELRARLPTLVAAIGEVSEEVAAELRAFAGTVSPRQDANRLLCEYERSVIRELEQRTRGGSPVYPASVGPTYADRLSDAAGAVVPYSTKAALSEGMLVSHPKFGRGVVLAVADNKATVHFEDKKRTLACNR